MPQKPISAASSAPFRKPITRTTLRLVHVDYWSVVKFWFFWSLLGGMATILVTLLIWNMLDQSGVLASLDTLLNDVAGNTNLNLEDFASLGQVLGFMSIVSALNVIVVTALAAIVAVLYNLTVAISGGLTLSFSTPPAKRATSTPKVGATKKFTGPLPHLTRSAQPELNNTENANVT